MIDRPTTEGILLTINGPIAAEVVELLMSKTAGPREAFGTICVALLMLNDINNDQLDKPLNREELIEEIRTSILSVETLPPKAQLQ